MNKKINKQSIGIIGGMGPQASAKLLEVLISMCSNNFDAKNDNDFPEVILNSLSVPDFITSKENLDKVLEILINRIKILDKFNPICFGIVCNTAHVMLDDLKSQTKTPFVSIIEEVVSDVKSSEIKKIGLLSTPVTVKTKLYEHECAKNQIGLIIPSLKEQKIVEGVIRNVLAGKSMNSDKIKLKLIANSLLNSGAEGIILGCTELPLIFPKSFPSPVFNSIEILAKALLKKYYDN